MAGPGKVKGAWLSAALVLGCGTANSPELPASARPPSEGAVIDVDAVMRSVRLSFRAEGRAFFGGARTYQVRAAAEGFEVAPLGAGMPAEGGAARFRTEAITRGSHAFSLEGRARVEADGASRDVRRRHRASA